MRRFVYFILAAWLFLSMGFTTGCMTHKALSKPGTTTTVILIRHADRNEQFVLTPKGKKRAQALVKALDLLNVSTIYSPDVERNLNTVRPLAQYLGIEITVTPQFSYWSVDAIAREILDKHAGKVVLWVGNVTGNLQALYHRLGGKGKGPLKYGEMSILTIPDQGKVIETQSRFGP